MKKKKTNSNRKLVKSLVIAIIVLIIGISAIYAHTSNRQFSNDMMSMMDMDGMNMNMNMDGMNMMNSMMHASDNSGGMMACMSMMKNMPKEEMEEMLRSMDKDNDGKCDMCIMSIKMCKQMMNN